MLRVGGESSETYYEGLVVLLELLNAAARTEAQRALRRHRVLDAELKVRGVGDAAAAAAGVSARQVSPSGQHPNSPFGPVQQ